MKPVIAIVGRPNVGKSTLFNKLTKSRDALVANLPGLTRDRQYGEGEFNHQNYIVIDTGGIFGEEDYLASLRLAQTHQAILEADIILFLVDAKAGLTAMDQEMAQWLRQQHKTIYVVVNKIDGLDERTVGTEFFTLGLGQLYMIAASHGQGIQTLLEEILLPLFKKPAEQVLQQEETDSANDEKRITFAVLGRPNVGKSTLVNRILGEERVIAFDQPGTTRDSIYIPFQRHDKHYTIIDTAGVRRRARIKQTVEKFSVIKTLQAVEQAQVVVYLIDAQEGVTEQDLHLLAFIVDVGRSLVIAVNKWDGLSTEQRQIVKVELARRMAFVDFATWHFISALHGSGVGNLFSTIDRAYASAMRKVSTNRVNQLLQSALKQHAPPLVNGRRIKLRYAHLGGHNPPIIIIHGNQTKLLPQAYQRYLANFFREHLKLVGTPIRIEFRMTENPYAPQRKTKKITLSQRRKKSRKQ
ncbi:MAG: ribosome biogenesis GTPase Der [Gammaproteobacteria bacterium]